MACKLAYCTSESSKYDLNSSHFSTRTAHFVTLIFFLLIPKMNKLGTIFFTKYIKHFLQTLFALSKKTYSRIGSSSQLENKSNSESGIGQNQTRGNIVAMYLDLNSIILSFSLNL